MNAKSLVTPLLAALPFLAFGCAGPHSQLAPAVMLKTWEMRLLESIAVESEDGKVTIIMERLLSAPASRSLTMAAQGARTRIVFRLYGGHETLDGKGRLIGTYVVSGFARHREGARVAEVRFSYDAGFEVTALDKATGLPLVVTFTEVYIQKPNLLADPSRGDARRDREGHSHFPARRLGGSRVALI